MRKFEIGDKVRVLTDRYEKAFWLHGARPHVGDVGVVTGYTEGYVVARFYGHAAPKNNIGDDGWRFFDAWLELVPKPTFSVGDRVRVVAPGRLSNGLEGEVIELLAYGRLNIRFTTGNDWWNVDTKFDYDPHELEPLARSRWSSPVNVAHVDDVGVDELLDSAIKTYQAQVTLNYDVPSATTGSGDALVVVENGQAKVYRLEAVLNDVNV